MWLMRFSRSGFRHRTPWPWLKRSEIHRSLRAIPIVGVASRRFRCAGFLYPSNQNEDEDDDQHESQTARGVITPARAIRPCGKRADQQEDKDDEKYRTKRHALPPKNEDPGCDARGLRPEQD